MMLPVTPRVTTNSPAISAIERCRSRSRLCTRSESPGVNVLDERDDAVEIGVLVVVQRHVAAVRAVEIAPLLDALRHHLNVLRIHRVVLRADGEGWHGDLREIG